MPLVVMQHGHRLQLHLIQDKRQNASNNSLIMGQNRSWVEIAALDSHNAHAPYTQITFHKVGDDNNFPYPLEDISHLDVTGRHSAPRTLHYIIILMHILSMERWPQGKLCYHVARAKFTKSRQRLGIALKPNVTSDPFRVVSKRPAITPIGCSHVPSK
jgi:hypothetical protein